MRQAMRRFRESPQKFGAGRYGRCRRAPAILRRDRYAPIQARKRVLTRMALVPSLTI